MKKLISVCTFLFLAACSQSQHSQPQVEGEYTFSDSASGIVGGNAVSAQDDISRTTVQVYQFQASFDRNGQLSGLGLAECTGSILANDIILTAGHCTVEDPGLIFLYFSKDKPKVASMNEMIKLLSSDPKARRVSGGMAPNLWANGDKSTHRNWGDIAVLKFTGGLPAGYHPAAIPSESTPMAAGQTVTLAGFGLIDGVKEIASNTLRKVDVTIENPSFSESEMMISTSAKKGSCHGDSGGPAYIKAKGQLLVAGVTSRADSQTDAQGKCIGLTVYTKVQPYLTWIAGSMKTLQDPNFKKQRIPQPF